MKTFYTASATVTGNGRDGHGRTSDGALDVDLAIPGSDRPGTNPEQLFALGYSACFLSALKSIAKTQNVTLADAAVTADVGLGRRADGSYGLAIELHVELGGGVEQSVAEELVDKAHRRCPYSQAIRGNVEVGIDVTTDGVAA